MTTPDAPPTAERSRLMSRIGGKNTKPEMMVRQLLHRRGYRYSLHARDLPGRPDIVFRRRRKVIFVHGCFWHRHPGCRYASTPKTRTEFWEAKFAANVARDRRNLNALADLGWESLVVWECETRDLDAAMARVVEFLGPPRTTPPRRSSLHLDERLCRS